MRRSPQLDEQLDVTAAGHGSPSDRLHPTDPDQARCRGHLPRASATRSSTAGRSRPSGTTSTRSPSSRLIRPVHRDTFFVDDDTLLRTHTSTAQIHSWRRSQPPIYIATLGRVYRRDTIEPDAPRRTSTRSRRSPSIAASDARRSEGHAAAFLPRAVRRRPATSACGRASSRSPSRRWSPTYVLPLRRQGLWFCKYTGWFEMGGAGVVDPACSRTWATTRRSGRGFAWRRARPHRAAPSRHCRDPHVLGDRPACPETVLSEVPGQLAAGVRPGRHAAP